MQKDEKNTEKEIATLKEMCEGYKEMYLATKQELLQYRNRKPQTTREICEQRDKLRLDKMKALIPDFSNNQILN